MRLIKLGRRNMGQALKLLTQHYCQQMMNAVENHCNFKHMPWVDHNCNIFFTTFCPLLQICGYKWKLLLFYGMPPQQLSLAILRGFGRTRLAIKFSWTSSWWRIHRELRSSQELCHYGPNRLHWSRNLKLTRDLLQVCWLGIDWNTKCRYLGKSALHPSIFYDVGN